MQTDDRREIYSYDRGRLRNRTVERQQDPAGSQTYTYRYDAQGNTLSDGENTYLYDCLNRITEVKTKAGDIQKKMKLVSISAISEDTNCLSPTVSGQGRIAIGTAKAQTKISDPRPGNGKQILFSKFDSNWITEVRNIKE